MPNLNGLTAARQMLQSDPYQKILILTIDDSEQIVREVLEAGARGFVLKSDAARDLLDAVDALEHDRNFFTSRVAEMILGDHRDPSAEQELTLHMVSSREREIVQLLAEGKSSKEVASILNLSVKTVETHRSNIMRKLGIHSLSELVLYAIRNNIVQVQIGPQ
jgi:DNA-binding NarL/FixJ family response regulator